MDIFMVSIFACCIVLIAACFYLYRRRTEAERRAQYQVTMRPFTVADLDFFRDHPGSTRYATLGERLNDLRSDYSSSCRMLLLLILQREIDGAAMAGRLIRNRLSFSAAVFGIRWRALLSRFGVGRVDCQQAVVRLDDIRADLCRLHS